MRLNYETPPPPRMHTPRRGRWAKMVVVGAALVIIPGFSIDLQGSGWDNMVPSTFMTVGFLIAGWGGMRLIAGD